MQLFGGIELGGTNYTCAIGNGSSEVIEEETFKTKNSTATFGQLQTWFQKHRRIHGSLSAIGIASFGPLNLVDGCIAATPKSGNWSGFPIRDRIQEALDLPVVLDTDVNGAALAEWTFGAGHGHTDMLYVTVGTGVGVGAIVDNKVVYGQNHPEMGHMRIPQHPTDTVPENRGVLWSGACRFHGTCWEGLASGHAIERRYGVTSAEDVTDGAAWKLEGEYLALGISNLICTYRPQRIVIGGGVMKHDGLLELVRTRVAELLNSEYFPEASNLDRVLVQPGLTNSGVIGAILFAAQAC